MNEWAVADNFRPAAVLRLFDVVVVLIAFCCTLLYMETTLFILARFCLSQSIFHLTFFNSLAKIFLPKHRDG